MKKDKTKLAGGEVLIEDIKKKAPLAQATEIKERKKDSRKNLSLKIFSRTAITLLLGFFALSAFLLFSEKNKPSNDFVGDLKRETYSDVDKIQGPSPLPEKESPPIEKETNEKNLNKPLEETDSMEKSEDRNWWLNSGGVAYFQATEFSTNKGPLPEGSAWRKLYAKHNSRDTDNGYYPQNIFRLVNKGEWKNFSQSVYFKIEKINLSASKYRNESNGILLFNRYQDGDNLYYTGLRVDGHVVIKKKISGKYYTLLEKSLFENKEKYHRKNNPNLIPKDNWIGIKSELENTKDDTVSIKIFIDDGKGGWRLVAETKDKGKKYGKSPFLGKGHAGIRTDFMDVNFKNYQITEK